MDVTFLVSVLEHTITLSKPDFRGEYRDDCQGTPNNIVLDFRVKLLAFGSAESLAQSNLQSPSDSNILSM